ncbi:heptaprenyl diphosphate synthase component 1 [Jeotgalibacillus sp. JSM ZJ347]|uniref:heptaprenyl diphosphate synthase component 1 n=1 Tax=Jeotgalibacillus sp. JSM ZJ347 TaxID=3342117 RepID=UPI0035A9A335
MSFKQYERWMNETVQHISDQIHHPYLHAAIGQPEIDIERLSLLLLPFYLKNKYTKLDQSYVATAILIQQALDTHEKVSSNNESHRMKQLTVLAGDYYSGLYYKILSDIPDIELIRKIARAIEVINEHKIEISPEHSLSEDEYLHSLTKIESSIITSLFRHLEFHDLVPLAENLLLIQRLKKEEAAYSQGQFSSLFYFFKHGKNHIKTSDYLRTYKNIIKRISEKVEHQVKELNLPSSTRNLPIFSSFYERLIMYAEEG